MTRRPQHNKFSVIPLGGVEEIGRNMTLVEYGRDIVIIDMGLQFPEEDMPGIDYIIPNIEYLKGKEDRIQGIIITHGHYDHIGAIPYLVEKLKYPPIYATALSRGIILKRQDDFPHLKPLEIHEVKAESKLRLGNFLIEFFHVNHNIFDTVGVVVSTHVGSLMHTADFKFDNNPVGDRPADYGKIAKFGDRGVLVLLSDSTGAEKAGHSVSEKTIQDNLEDIFRKTKGRIIAATFASLISRIQQLVSLSEKYGRKVVVEGYSMKTNVEITRNLGYLHIQKSTLLPIKEAHRYPPDRLTVVCTGAQGEGSAVLMRLVNKEHKFLNIQKGDTVIFSSSVVPGNERSVQGLKDLIYRQGGKVYHYGMMDIHASGHAYQEDLKMMLQLVRPKFFVPVHGNHYMLKLHGELAKETGVPVDNIVIPENGMVIEVAQNKITPTKIRVPSNYVMVDGLGVGDVGNVVLRDRQMMAEDGMFVVIAIVDSKTGKVLGNPDIISRGFIYLRDNKVLLKEVRQRVRGIVEETGAPKHGMNWTYVKDNIRERIGQFLYSKTKRRPMVLPVVIEI